MDVVFRTDASTGIGSGHVMRCLTLAIALKQRNVRCGFVCRKLPGNLMPRIEQAGFPVLGLPFNGGDQSNFEAAIGPRAKDCLKKGHFLSFQTAKSRKIKSPSKGYSSFQTEPNWREFFDPQVPLAVPPNSTTTITDGITALRRVFGWDELERQSDVDSDRPVGQHRFRQSSKRELAIKTRIDWLIVDHYSIDWQWEQAIRPYFKQLMVIDDKADRRHDCDLLLDQNLVDEWQSRYQGKVPARCRVMLGPEFAMLQPEYTKIRSLLQQNEKIQDKPQESFPNKPIQRIFVYFGGADQKNITAQVMAAIEKAGRSDLTIDVVTSLESIENGCFASFTKSAVSFRFHHSLPTLANLLSKADLAIGAGGATTWERCCLGVPSIVISIADNQKPIAESLHRRGMIRYLGDQDNIDESEIAKALTEVVDQGIDVKWRQRCLDLVDGGGTERVVSSMLLNQLSPLTIRDVDTNDEQSIFDWANDPEVRASSFRTEPINWDSHRGWFREKLQNQSQSEFWIVQTAEGLKLAQIRFDRLDQLAGDRTCWRLNYSLARHARGIGLAAPIVTLGLQTLRTKYSRSSVVAEVRPNNWRSCKTLKKLGFELIQKKTDRLVYQIVLIS